MSQKRLSIFYVIATHIDVYMFTLILRNVRSGCFSKMSQNAVVVVYKLTCSVGETLSRNQYQLESRQVTGFSCGVISSQFCKSSYSRPPCWFPFVRPCVIYCRVLVEKCPGAYSTQWRYIVHVIIFNQGHAIYFVTSY